MEERERKRRRGKRRNGTGGFRCIDKGADEDMRGRRQVEVEFWKKRGAKNGRL